MAELGGVAVHNGETLTNGTYAVRQITNGFVITREGDYRVLSHIFRQLDTAVAPWRKACATVNDTPAQKPTIAQAEPEALH